LLPNFKRASRNTWSGDISLADLLWTTASRV
jgi:hypothetical protein